MNTDRLKCKEITDSIPIINYLAVTNIETWLIIEFWQKTKLQKICIYNNKIKNISGNQRKPVAEQVMKI